MRHYTYHEIFPTRAHLFRYNSPAVHSILYTAQPPNRLSSPVVALQFFHFLVKLRTKPPRRRHCPTFIYCLGLIVSRHDLREGVQKVRARAKKNTRRESGKDRKNGERCCRQSTWSEFDTWVWEVVVEKKSGRFVQEVKTMGSFNFRLIRELVPFLCKDWFYSYFVPIYTLYL